MFLVSQQKPDRGSGPVFCLLVNNSDRSKLWTLLSSLILYIFMNRQCFDSVRISKNILLCTGFINDHALLVSKPCKDVNVLVTVRPTLPLP